MPGRVMRASTASAYSARRRSPSQASPPPGFSRSAATDPTMNFALHTFRAQWQLHMHQKLAQWPLVPIANCMGETRGINPRALAPFSPYCWESNDLFRAISYAAHLRSYIGSEYALQRKQEANDGKLACNRSLHSADPPRWPSTAAPGSGTHRRPSAAEHVSI